MTEGSNILPRLDFSAFKRRSDGKVIRWESAMREDRLCLSEVATSLIDLVVDANSYLLSETSPKGYTFDIYWSREPAERDLAMFGVSPSAHASA